MDAAARKRKSRENLKNDPEKLAIYLEKERERSKKKRQSNKNVLKDNEKLKASRLANNRRIKRYRDKIKRIRESEKISVLGRYPSRKQMLRKSVCQITQMNMDYNYLQELSSKISKGELVLSPGNKRSKCWNVFARIEDLNGEQIKGFVFCRMCEKIYTFNQASTSNLLRHGCYKKAYSNKTISIIKVETPQLEMSNASMDTDETDNFNNNLEKLLTKWLIRNCRSYDMIQDDGLKAVFQEFISIGAKFGTDIDVDRFLPSSSHMANTVADIYEESLSRVREEIASVKDNGFGLAIDSWTDMFSKKNYIALTIHFLKNENLTFRLLALKSIEAHNIYESVETILKDFDCKLSNNSILVTKNVNNFKAAFKNCENISCISQLLNQALQTAIEEVAEIKDIAKYCVKLVNFLKSSQFNRPLQDLCPNRWITQYNMFKSLESNWNEITNFLQDRNEQKLTEQININYIKALIKTLQPFEEALETLEDENSATLHLVFVYLHELKKSCDINDSEFNDFDFIESLKAKLLYYLDEIVKENLTILHKIALFLYPPTNKLLQFSEEEKKSIETECIRLMKSLKPVQLQPAIKQEPETTLHAPVPKRKKFFSDFVEPETSRDPNELIMHELQCYKFMRVVNSQEFDVFLWWEQQKDNLPLLYKLSCSVLATPASCASAQRIFSSASSLLCENALDLGQSDTKVEQIMFINANSEHEDVDSEFDLK